MPVGKMGAMNWARGLRMTLAISALGMPQSGAQAQTLTGCSGKSTEAYGITRDVYGTWMGRSSWNNLAHGD